MVTKILKKKKKWLQNKPNINPKQNQPQPDF